MARIPQVTRTIQTTEAKIMCLDVVRGEPIIKEVSLPRTYKDEESLLKQAKNEIETDEIKVVHVVDSFVKETLYGMSEQDFIKVANVLPPRGTKETNDNE